MTRLCVLALALGCGTRTGLDITHAERDGGTDAPSALDAGATSDAALADGGVPSPCVVLPPEEPPTEIIVSFVSRVVTADVLFLVDTTGSMRNEIARIRETLRDVLAPAMGDAIGDVQLSVASIADFPVGTYGAPDDAPFLLLQSSTADVAEAQRAIDALPASSGLDGPEAQTEALYQTATGEGIGRFVPPAACPSGVGYPCFRSDGNSDRPPLHRRSVSQRSFGEGSVQAGSHPARAHVRRGGERAPCNRRESARALLGRDASGRTA